MIWRRVVIGLRANSTPWFQCLGLSRIAPFPLPAFIRDDSCNSWALLPVRYALQFVGVEFVGPFTYCPSPHSRLACRRGLATSHRLGHRGPDRLLVYRVALVPAASEMGKGHPLRLFRQRFGKPRPHHCPFQTGRSPPNHPAHSVICRRSN